MTKMIEEKAHYVVVELAKGAGFEVHKLVKDPDSGEWITEAKHVTRDNYCDCKGFEYRGDCRHIHYIKEDKLETRPVDLAEARRVAASVVKHLDGAFPYVGLEDEPYERDANGMIVKIKMLAKAPDRNEPVRMFVLAEGVLVRLRLVKRIDL